MHKGFAFVQFTNPFDARSACVGEDARTVLGQTLGNYYIIMYDIKYVECTFDWHVYCFRLILGFIFRFLYKFLFKFEL